MLRWHGTRPVALTLVALALAASTAGAQTFKYPLGAHGKYTPEGMLIQTVNSGSPLEKVGLQKGDLILKVDGQLITNQDDLAGVINTSGGSVVLVIRKGGTGKAVRITADLDGRGKGIWAPYLLGVIGQFTKDGMLVATTIPGTPAAAAGLGKGDLIGRINNQPIRTQEELYAVLNASGGAATLLVRNGRTGRVGTIDVDLTTYELGALGEFTRDGMVVATVAPATPAERCGLQKGDLIVRIDNQPIRTQDDFNAIINGSGGSVILTVRKAPNGRAVQFPVELMNNPLGAWCEPVQEGMRVTAVVTSSSADRIGLDRGDVILKIDDQRVRSQQDLLAALFNSGGFVSMAVRKGQSGRVVKLEADLAR